MFSACGNEVIYLKRISMGNLKLDNSIAVGSYKQLSEEEIQILRNS
jgi:16S rRNA pseudouridine516 synthase